MQFTPLIQISIQMFRCRLSARPITANDDYERVI